MDRQTGATGSTTTNPQGTQSKSASGGATAPQSEQERQLRVSHEGAREGGREAARAGGRDVATRRGTAPPTRGPGQGSVLPALMANPWLMTNAFMSNPFGFAQAMSQEMDRLFGSQGDVTPATAGQGGRSLASYGGQPGARGLMQWTPQVEVRRRGDELVVSADLPGLAPEDVDVELDDGVLTISGERRQSNEDRSDGFYRSERSYGTFSRSIALPEGVDENAVQARFEHGVLEVTVPLPKERQRARRVQIQAGAGTTPGAKPNASGATTNKGASGGGAEA